MTQEELGHRRGRRPKDGIVWVTESRFGKHKCRRITKWKDNKEEGTVTFITNDFDTPASILCEVYRRRWQIETLFKRLKQNFPLKYFWGDSQNAIRIQIWVCMIAWLAHASHQTASEAQVEPVQHDDCHSYSAQLLYWSVRLLRTS